MSSYIGEIRIGKDYQASLPPYLGPYPTQSNESCPVANGFLEEEEEETGGEQVGGLSTSPANAVRSVGEINFLGAPAADGMTPGAGTDDTMLPEHGAVLVWNPKSISDDSLLMFLHAARSITAFAGMCRKKNGNREDGASVVSRDETTQRYFDMLHENEYNVTETLDILNKDPLPKIWEKEWTHDEAKCFSRAIKIIGKEFPRVRDEYLKHKRTKDLIQFYYFWKKSPYNPSRNQRRNRRNRKAANSNSNKSNSKNRPNAAPQDLTDSVKLEENVFTKTPQLNNAENGIRSATGSPNRTANSATDKVLIGKEQATNPEDESIFDNDDIPLLNLVKVARGLASINSTLSHTPLTNGCHGSDRADQPLKVEILTTAADIKVEVSSAALDIKEEFASAVEIKVETVSPTDIKSDVVVMVTGSTHPDLPEAIILDEGIAAPRIISSIPKSSFSADLTKYEFELSFPNAATSQVTVGEADEGAVVIKSEHDVQPTTSHHRTTTLPTAQDDDPTLRPRSKSTPGDNTDPDHSNITARVYPIAAKKDEIDAREETDASPKDLEKSQGGIDIRSRSLTSEVTQNSKRSDVVVVTLTDQNEEEVSWRPTEIDDTWLRQKLFRNGILKRTIKRPDGSSCARSDLTFNFREYIPIDHIESTLPLPNSTECRLLFDAMMASGLKSTTEERTPRYGIQAVENGTANHVLSRRYVPEDRDPLTPEPTGCLAPPSLRVNASSATAPATVLDAYGHASLPSLLPFNPYSPDYPLFLPAPTFPAWYPPYGPLIMGGTVPPPHPPNSFMNAAAALMMPYFMGGTPHALGSGLPFLNFEGVTDFAGSTHDSINVNKINEVLEGRYFGAARDPLISKGTRITERTHPTTRNIPTFTNVCDSAIRARDSAKMMANNDRPAASLYHNAKTANHNVGKSVKTSSHGSESAFHQIGPYSPDDRDIAYQYPLIPPGAISRRKDLTPVEQHYNNQIADHSHALLNLQRSASVANGRRPANIKNGGRTPPYPPEDDLVRMQQGQKGLPAYLYHPAANFHPAVSPFLQMYPSHLHPTGHHLDIHGANTPSDYLEPLSRDTPTGPKTSTDPYFRSRDYFNAREVVEGHRQKIAPVSASVGKAGRTDHPPAHRTIRAPSPPFAPWAVAAKPPPPPNVYEYPSKELAPTIPHGKRGSSTLASRPTVPSVARPAHQGSGGGPSVKRKASAIHNETEGQAVAPLRNKRTTPNITPGLDSHQPSLHPSSRKHLGSVPLQPNYGNSSINSNNLPNRATYPNYFAANGLPLNYQTVPSTQAGLVRKHDAPPTSRYGPAPIPIPNVPSQGRGRSKTPTTAPATIPPSFQTPSQHDMMPVPPYDPFAFTPSPFLHRYHHQQHPHPHLAPQQAPFDMAHHNFMGSEAYGQHAAALRAGYLQPSPEELMAAAAQHHYHLLQQSYASSPFPNHLQATMSPHERLVGDPKRD